MWLWHICHQNKKMDHMIVKHCKPDQTMLKHEVTGALETIKHSICECVLGRGVFQQECTRCVHPQSGSRIHDWSIIGMSRVLGQAGGNTSMGCLSPPELQVL